MFLSGGSFGLHFVFGEGFGFQLVFVTCIRCVQMHFFAWGCRVWQHHLLQGQDCLLLWCVTPPPPTSFRCIWGLPALCLSHSHSPDGVLVGSLGFRRFVCPLSPVVLWYDSAHLTGACSPGLSPVLLLGLVMVPDNCDCDFFLNLDKK